MLYRCRFNGFEPGVMRQVFKTVCLYEYTICINLPRRIRTVPGSWLLRQQQSPMGVTVDTMQKSIADARRRAQQLRRWMRRRPKSTTGLQCARSTAACTNLDEDWSDEASDYSGQLFLRCSRLSSALRSNVEGHLVVHRLLYCLHGLVSYSLLLTMR